MKNQDKTTALSAKISTLADSLPSLASVASGYEYRDAISAFWAECQKEVNAVMPEPRVCGAGSGLYIDCGRAVSPCGALEDAQKAQSAWMDHARVVALGAGAVPVFAGVDNALAAKCGPAAVV